jgi:3-dehydroquinate synthase
MDRLTVDLAGRSYDILVGPGLLAEAGRRIREALGRRRLIVLSDETVAPLYARALVESLHGAGHDVELVTVPAGEGAKDIHRFPALADRLLGLGLDRKAVLVALGGGVIGDLTGFAAATLLRGIEFVQIPTTLLAQIDSSVGGKTGVNAGAGKNLVGAFHQPRLVLADLDVLSTLPARELRAGYAEMAKYGLLGDAAFFRDLEVQAPRILTLDPALVGPAIVRCCRMKAMIVAEDEREAGRRALLNLGHTFGHALEAETGFGPALLHGESVALGMVLAADLSVALDRLGAAAASRIADHLGSVGLPTRMSQIPGAPFAASRLIEHMAHDKKAEGGSLTFVILDGIGSASLVRQVAPETVAGILRAAGAV